MMLLLTLRLQVVTLVLTVYASAAFHRVPVGRSLIAHRSLARRTVELSQLFPINALSSWTTFPDGAEGTVMPLEDDTINPVRVLSSTRHSYTKAPDNKTAMRAFYPEGSYTFDYEPQGGFSFWSQGPTDMVDIESAKEITFGYSLFFPDGFDFNKGGKLPGIYGGDTDQEARGCTGSKKSDACFSSRLMWRTGGDGELYTYLPPDSANKAQCSAPPKSICSPVHGNSVGRGAYQFATGAWTTVTQRVRLNDIGKENGELELWANGASVINVSGLVLRTSEEAKIRGMIFQTFFGGGDDSWASPKDQEVFMADFSFAVTEEL